MKFISVKEAAKTLGVSQATIRNFILKEKLFKACRVGKQLRIDFDSFERYMESIEIK